MQLNNTFAILETKSSPLKIGRAPKGHFSCQPLIFRGYVSFRTRTQYCIVNAFADIWL